MDAKTIVLKVVKQGVVESVLTIAQSRALNLVIQHVVVDVKRPVKQYVLTIVNQEIIKNE